MKRNKAFTLVEVIVAIAISCVVLAAIYTVWLRITREINKSHARQTLQNELRTAANYMQRDFKSIKADTFEIANQNSDNTNVSLKFEVFKEAEEGKLAQDSSSLVEYRLLNNLLTRRENNIEKILSVHIDSFSLARAEDGDVTALENFNEDFKAGREAKLDITLVGKYPIRGVNQDVWHVEKTSVVMRQEYYKNVNKTYVSNFELAQKKLEDVLLKDDAADSSFMAGCALSEAYLQSLDRDALEGMLSAQNAMLEQVKQSIQDMNDGIKSTETGESGWDKFWSSLTGGDGPIVRGLRKDLAKADSKEECKDIIKKLEEFTSNKEEQFLAESLKTANINAANLSDEQRSIYKEAYEMKLQDRSIKGAYEAQKSDGKELEEPKYMIDTYKGAMGSQVVLKDSKENVINISQDSNASVDKRRQQVIDAYDKIDLAWMGNFGDEREDIGIYNAAKSLINQGKSKIDVLDMRDTTSANIDKINNAMKGK